LVHIQKLVHTQNRGDLCLIYLPHKLAPHIRRHRQAPILSDASRLAGAAVVGKPIHRFTGAGSALPVARGVHLSHRAPRLALWEFVGSQTYGPLPISTSGNDVCRILRTGYRTPVEVLKAEGRLPRLRSPVLSWSRSMRLSNAGYVVGAAILSAAAFIYARASVSQGDAYVEPLVIPVSFAAGFERSVQITTRINHTFELVIDVPENQLKTQPTDTDMTWKILDGSGVTAQGNSEAKPWEDWWGTLEQKLGNFPGRAGRHYTLTIRVNRGPTELASASPVLKVRIPRGDWEGYGAGVAIEKGTSGVLGFLGLVIVCCAFQLRRRSRTRRVGEPTG